MPSTIKPFIEVCRGPHGAWVDAAGHARFLDSDWKLSAKSDRSGFRLEDPEWTFTRRACDKRPEHGSDANNIIEQGYPVGARNVCGQTPSILVHDAPSGGFINPYTVPGCAFWKRAQAKPGDRSELSRNCRARRGRRWRWRSAG